jgi:hypothetical protein
MSINRIRTAWLGGLPLAVLLVGLLALPGRALAHEHRTIANGQFDVTVGWDSEPAYTGQKNGAGIRIAVGGSNPSQPVTGAEQTMKIRMRQGAQTQEFPLRPVPGQPGYYVADIIPTRTGDYQWTFVGSINGTPVNETFDTADGKFDKAEDVSAIEFPVVPADPSAAVSSAQSAQTMAYVGIGIGVLGLLVALAALAMLLRRPSTPGTPPAPERRPEPRVA